MFNERFSGLPPNVCVAPGARQSWMMMPAATQAAVSANHGRAQRASTVRSVSVNTVRSGG